MLAFTVQFSRYGRNRTYSAPVQGPFGQAVRGSALSEAAAPSGPNSVPSTIRADEINTLGMLNSQCSTRKHGRRDERVPSDGAGAP